jgi:tRNA pseudouridine32 synthase/23S rRNA pseudouridine746 synthase
VERPLILYADPHLVVVDKPAGLPSVPGRPLALHDCAASRVQAMYGDALTVHRLDMATSGLLLLARGLEMQRALGHLFEQRRVDKRYEAVVAGRPAAEEGQIDLPLIADWPRRPRQMVDHQIGKSSLTHWRVLGEEPTANTRLELQPLTGRSHQLRVHLSAIGHPILGDDLYAPEAVCQASPRLLLHATRLAFVHPGLGRAVSFHSPAPF